MNTETKITADNFALHMINKINTIGSLDENGYPIRMSGLIEEVCVSGVDFRYADNGSYLVLFDDGSCICVDEKNNTIKQSHYYELTITVKFVCSESRDFGKEEQWTLEEVLAEINRDHSDDWRDYTELDWVEGWLQWVDGEFYSISKNDLKIDFFS